MGMLRTMLLRYLFRPLDPTSLLLIAIFTILLELLIGGGLYGLIMSIFVLSWFFKYAYVLVDAAANGIDKPPVLSVEMLNPADEQRPVAQLAICASVGWVAYKLGGTAGIVVAVIGLLYLPASIAVLGASSRAIDAVNPVALTRVIKGLGLYYVFILGVVVVYAIAVVVVVRSSLWQSLQIGFLMFCVLSLFTVLGGALYERRHVLGLDPTHTPERKAERAERERSKERHKALDEVYGEARGGNMIAARESLLRWLRFTEPDWLERDVRFIFDQARTWQDERVFVFVSRFLISQLIEMGKTGTVVEIVDGVLARAPTLKLGTASDTVKIATLARAAGKRALALRVLAPFETQFPGDARTPEVAVLRSEISP
jgi:hypothetical protein